MKVQLNTAIETLCAGGVVAYPTDTVYGLGANAFDPEAVLRIFLVKRRSLSLPLPLLVADVDMLRAVVSDLPPEAARLVEQFMPGPLTLVLPKAASIPGIVTAGELSVAVRIPDHEVPISLAKGLAGPIVGTSANQSGMPSMVTPEAVAKNLGSEIDGIVHGHCPGGVESTIVDYTGNSLDIVREGAISRDEILEVVGAHES